jgi:hypothetical protein
LRRSLAALGVVALLSATGCARISPQEQRSVSGTTDPPRVPLAFTDEHFVRGWPDNAGGTAWIGDGSYQLYAGTPARFVAVRAPVADVPQDVIVSGIFRKVGGPPGGGYGIILRDQRLGAGDGIDQSGEFIVAEVGDQGQVGVWRRMGDRWLDMLPWTASTAVRTDRATNALTVQLNANRLVFRVNGSQVVDLAVGAARRTGGVGIFAGGDLNQVTVEQFQVQVPIPLASSSSATNPGLANHGPPASAQSARSVFETQRARDLLGSIANNVGAIFESFSNGIDGPHSPVNDPAALRDAKARLDAATRAAEELATELRAIQGRGADDGG